MDATHLHLLLNHIPILGTLFGLCVLAYGLLAKQQTVEKTGYVTLIAVSLLAIPAYLTGEETEEAVEHLPGVSTFFIEQHEEWASIAFWLMMAAGLTALIALLTVLVRKERSATLGTITLILTLITFGAMTVAGSYGGKIRHSELRNEQQANQPGANDNYSIEHDDDFE